METIGVILLLLVTFFIYKKGNTKAKSSRFSGKLKNVDKSELAQAKLGDYIRTWYYRKDDVVEAHTPGSVGPAGLIGHLDGVAEAKAKRQLKNGNKLNCKATRITKNNLEVECEVITKEELRQRKEEIEDSHKKKMEEAINKPYKPKNSLVCTLVPLDLDKPIKVNKGMPVELEFGNKDDYLDKSFFEIPVIDPQSRERVALIKKESDQKMRLLRAYFNNYRLEAYVSESSGSYDKKVSISFKEPEN